ncbi:hypothetical protein EYF80_003147 [Liparis tanakae]|uniref:Uncharacterized protein n=1 Tax=Liparis tanakae TaxID=230148 RepID=A0A4Z2J916_9TELE|nr:hypothetical protein EYF80_003147 [Liparis tanakae]
METIAEEVRGCLVVPRCPLQDESSQHSVLRQLTEIDVRTETCWENTNPQIDTQKLQMNARWKGLRKRNWEREQAQLEPPRSAQRCFMLLL